MAGAKPTKQILGYISAYLKQPRRSLAEAEREYEADRRLDQESGAQVDTNAGLDTAREPQS